MDLKGSRFSLNGKSKEGYFLEVPIQYPEELHKLDNDSHFLPDRMKTKKVQKLVAKLHDKNEYVINRINLT